MESMGIALTALLVVLIIGIVAAVLLLQQVRHG